jgi:hypothetical protein
MHLQRNVKKGRREKKIKKILEIKEKASMITTTHSQSRSMAHMAYLVCWSRLSMAALPLQVV